ncbi:MAG: YchJ family metal-binding protein [Arcobacteraceae bacterium]
MSVNSPCPCGTGNKYKKCCQPFHKGKLPSTALELMRSRYCAYAFAITSYIIKTTHPKNIDYSKNTTLWTQDILQFSTSFTFKKLTILEFIEDIDSSYVTFTATIFQNTIDQSFTEKSMFKKVNNQWLYHSGIHL